MMSDSRQFVLVMIVAALFAAWLGWRGMAVITVNNAIQADEELTEYPYPFRVLRLDGQTAVMTTLRSPSVSTQLALQTLFPELEGLSDSHPEFRRTEREYARLQARATQVVLDQPGIARIRWELDENWYYLNDVRIRPMTLASGSDQATSATLTLATTH